MTQADDLNLQLQALKSPPNKSSQPLPNAAAESESEADSENGSDDVIHRFADDSEALQYLKRKMAGKFNNNHGSVQADDEEVNFTIN